MRWEIAKQGLRAALCCAFARCAVLYFALTCVNLHCSPKLDHTLLQALRESKHYSVQQQSLDRQLRDCVYNIRNKEDLIAALHQNETQAKQLSQQYLVSDKLL